MSGKKPEKHLSITCSIRSAGRKKLLVYHIAKRAFLFLKYSLPDKDAEFFKELSRLFKLFDWDGMEKLINATK